VKRRRAGLLVALMVLSALAAGPVLALWRGAPEEVLRGTVTYVFDGDTIRVRLDGGGTRKVRLIGVDCPELDDDREAVRFLSFVARRFAHTRLIEKKVALIAGPEKQDAYGRLLAFVEMEDGTIFNETLVREGFAWAFLKFPFDESLRKRLKAAEAEARASGRGLWRAEPYPVVEAAEARARLAEIVTVRFRCARATERGRLRILEAEGALFEVVIPAAVLTALPGSLDFKGRTLEATGLVEEFRGRPQIMIGVPSQLREAGIAERGVDRAHAFAYNVIHQLQEVSYEYSNVSKIAQGPCRKARQHRQGDGETALFHHSKSPGVLHRRLCGPAGGSRSSP
jgi:micrococcal nuclease